MYILEDRVLFEPVSRWLTEDDREVRLSVSASRCLELLIIYQGKPVTRNELLQRVWYQHGSIVTDSSVRQTLHLLRKVLCEFRLSKNLIRTSRRQGYSIDITQVTIQHTSIYCRLSHLWKSKSNFVLLILILTVSALGYKLSVCFFNEG